MGNFIMKLKQTNNKYISIYTQFQHSKQTYYKAKGFSLVRKNTYFGEFTGKKKKCSFSQPSGFMAGPDHNRYKII